MAPKFHKLKILQDKEYPADQAKSEKTSDKVKCKRVNYPIKQVQFPEHLEPETSTDTRGQKTSEATAQLTPSTAQASTTDAASGSSV